MVVLREVDAFLINRSPEPNKEYQRPENGELIDTQFIIYAKSNIAYLILFYAQYTQQLKVKMTLAVESSSNNLTLQSK